MACCELSAASRGLITRYLFGWMEALARRASLRAKSTREQGLCKRERQQDPVSRLSDQPLTAFDGLCVVIKTTADF